MKNSDVDSNIIINKKKRILSSLCAMAPMIVCAIVTYAVPVPIVKVIAFIGVIVFSILSKKFLFFFDRRFKTITRKV